MGKFVQILHVLKNIGEELLWAHEKIHRSILWEKKKSTWMLKGGIVGTPQVATQRIFFAKVKFEWKSTTSMNHFQEKMKSTISVQIRFSVFHFFPRSLGVRICIEKTEPNKRASGFRVKNASNLQQKTVTSHHPASWIAILEFLRPNIWWILLDTKTPEKNELKN